LPSKCRGAVLLDVRDEVAALWHWKRYQFPWCAVAHRCCRRRTSLPCRSRSLHGTLSGCGL